MSLLEVCFIILQSLKFLLRCEIKLHIIDTSEVQLNRRVLELIVHRFIFFRFFNPLNVYFGYRLLFGLTLKKGLMKIWSHILLGIRSLLMINVTLVVVRAYHATYALSSLKEGLFQIIKVLIIRCRLRIRNTWHKWRVAMLLNQCWPAWHDWVVWLCWKKLWFILWYEKASSCVRWVLRVALAHL